MAFRPPLEGGTTSVPDMQAGPEDVDLRTVFIIRLSPELFSWIRQRPTLNMTMAPARGAGAIVNPTGSALLRSRG